jgi:transcriptional regulator with XRE-family HTH domain
MEKNWEAVARVIDTRMRELDLTQTELAVRAGVAPETVRELRTNLRSRRRNPRTLAAISEALGWPPERLSDVLGGDVTHESVNGDRDGVKVELARLRQAVDDLSERLAAVERQIGTR